MSRAEAVETNWGALYVRTFGAAGPPALVALHGFTLTGAMFADLARRLDRTVAAPDLPGHGRSRLSPVSIETAGLALAAWLRVSDAPIPMLGYSQGGRIALHVALQYPELVSALVIVSAAPGIGDASERAARLARDDATASRLERVGLDRFLDVWVDQPVIGTGRVGPVERARDRSIRNENTAVGLGAALRGMGQGSQPDLLPRLPEIDIPGLFIAGADDAVYAAHAEHMAECMNGRVSVIDDAGHNVILEKPREVAALVSQFLDGDDASRVSRRPSR